MIIKTSLNGADRGFLLSYIKSNSTGAEIGVWKGEFSYHILQSCKPKLLYLIDSWIEYPTAYGVLKEADVKIGAADERYNLVLEKFDHNIKDGRVKVIRANTEVGVTNIPDHSLDWVYVDAGHTYLDVKNDLNCILPKMKKGSFIMGDDYNPNAWKGVVQAVNEFIGEHKLELIEQTNCQYVLMVK